MCVVDDEDEVKGTSDFCLSSKSWKSVCACLASKLFANSIELPEYIKFAREQETKPGS